MKTNNKHTKGPWKIEINDGEIEIWSQNTFIAGVMHDLYFTTEKSGQHTANAALIAAAPELYEILQLIGTIANVGLDADSDYKNRMKRISEHVTETLKKARGE